MDKRARKALKEALKVAIAIIIIIVGIAAAIYYGVWVMFIQSILSACAAFDAGTLTATTVGLTLIKCIFASTVAGLIVSVSCGIAKSILK